MLFVTLHKQTWALSSQQSESIWRKEYMFYNQPRSFCGPPQPLAQAKDGMSAGDVEAALKQVPFKLGGGKTELSLFEVVPSYAVQVHIASCMWSRPTSTCACTLQ